MKETIDHLHNIVSILHLARKKNKRIGARLKHFYASKEQIKVQLTGRGWVIIDTICAVNGVSEISKEAIQRILDSFEVK
jgi:hypothetical protein